MPDEYDGPITELTLLDGTTVKVRGHVDDIRAKVSEVDLRNWKRNDTDDGWTPDD